MLAVLYYLLNDMEAARDAMERNMNSHDTSTSAENLKRVIQEQTEVNCSVLPSADLFRNYA
jgi:hypothetical protein